MKHIIQHGLLLTAFIFGLLFRMTAQSSQIVVFLNDGNEQTYNLTETDRLYFEDNTKLVIEQVSAKDAVSIPLADIRKITCNEYASLAEGNGQNPAIFPNPVHDVLTLRNLQGKQSISLYTIDGRLVKSMEVDENQTVDISDLPIGLYLLKTESCTLKMIKL